MESMQKQLIVMCNELIDKLESESILEKDEYSAENSLIEDLIILNKIE